MMASETEFKGHRITRQMVLNAMAAFDAAFPDSNSYENWLESKGYKHAIEHEGRLYPPKYILSEITGECRDTFSGGEQTNSVFEALGFTIVPK